MDPQELQARYRGDGYVVLPRFVADADLAALGAAIEAAPERDAGENPLTLGSMRFASNLFYASVDLQAFLASSAVTQLLTALVGPDVWVRWDQAVWKHDGAPAFPLHQDNGYTGLGAEHLQLWIALTPMTQDDGGLLVVPGAHTEALPHRWEGNHVRTDVDRAMVAVEVDAGDAIAFSSYLPHATAPNVSGRTRLAYVAEFLPASVGDPTVAPPHFRLTESGRTVGRFDMPTGSSSAPSKNPVSRRRWRWWRRPRNDGGTR